MIPDPHSISSVDKACVINLHHHDHPQGKISVIENYPARVLPFDVRRVFYLYDVPADSNRGGHSHFCGQELIVAISGSFEVELHDGVKSQRWRLDRPYKGLYVPTGLWRTIDNFSGGAVCMVLTSIEYSEEDYVRDFERFLTLTAPKRQ